MGKMERSEKRSSMGHPIQTLCISVILIKNCTVPQRININIIRIVMNRQSWTFEEDEAICSLVSQLGLNNWTKIAGKLKDTYSIAVRTGKQCRERWYNHLNPAVNKKPWDNQEEEQLFYLHKLHGNRWKDISRHFTGRTDNDIKNHFYSTLRRSLRRLNKISGEKNSTSQMREIKPSVLSTIMNYIYQQQHGLQNELVRSLQDLPSLIFEFANFKPIKTNFRHSKIDDNRDKISQIFNLIARFNEEYERNKLQKHHSKQKRLHSKRNSPQATSLPPPQPQVVIINSPQRKFCSQSTLKQASSSYQEGQQFQDEHFKGSRELNEERVEEQMEQLQRKFSIRNMSLDAQDQEEAQMPELLQPEANSIMGDQSGILDLTVVGRHWEPQSWQRQAELKIFVDEVLESHFDL